MNFSKRHKLHFLLILLQGLHFFSILHLMLKGLLVSFNVHTFFESSVSFLLLVCSKDALSFLNRSLKFVASSVKTVAW